MNVQGLFPVLNLSEPNKEELGLIEYKLPNRVKLFEPNNNNEDCCYCGRDREEMPLNISKRIRETQWNRVCMRCFMNNPDNQYAMEEFCDKYWNNDLAKTKDSVKIWNEENDLFLRINCVLPWERKVFVENFCQCRSCNDITHYTLKENTGVEIEAQSICIDCWRKENEEDTWDTMKMYFERYSSILN